MFCSDNKQICPRTAQVVCRGKLVQSQYVERLFDFIFVDM